MLKGSPARKRFPIVAAVVVLLAPVALTLAALPAAAQSYSVLKKILIPGQGSWDYLTVDESARRLYVSHGTQVEVIDLDSRECMKLLEDYILANPAIWNEDIGEV